MALHDTYARRTPFELALPDHDFPERHFEGIADEAAARKIPLRDPGAFAMLDRAAAALEELRRPDDSQESVPQHAAVLFHAYHHHRAGRPLLLVRTGVVRYLVETDPGESSEGDDRGIPPGAYVQLPQHLVWMRGEGEDTPVSLDGFFWTVTEGEHAHLLAISGMLGDRPGFTTIPVPPAPLADRRLWARTAMRREGEDFASSIPGAEIESLLEVRVAGEILKLAARLDAYLRRFPDAVSPPASSSRDGPPTPSALPWRAVTLD